MPKHWKKSLKQRLEPEKWTPYRKCKNPFFIVKWESRKVTGGAPRFTVMAENGEKWIFCGVPIALFDEFRKLPDSEVLLSSMISKYGTVEEIVKTADQVTAIHGDSAMDTVADDLKTFDEWFSSLKGMDDGYNAEF